MCGFLYWLVYQFNEQYGSYVTELVISGRIVRRATYIFEDKCRYVKVYNTYYVYSFTMRCVRLFYTALL